MHYVDMCCSKVPASASVALVSEPNSYHGLLLEVMMFNRSDDRAASSQALGPGVELTPSLAVLQRCHLIATFTTTRAAVKQNGLQHATSYCSRIRDVFVAHSIIIDNRTPCWI